MNMKIVFVATFLTLMLSMELLAHHGRIGLFSSETIHGALANCNPDNRRAALSIRYLGDDVTWDPRVGTDPIIQATDVVLQPGDPLDGEPMFPQLWP